jgi:hypothetical protein
MSSLKVCLFSSLLFVNAAAIGQIRFRVVNDENQGVESKVFRINAQSEIDLGPTEKDGSKTLRCGDNYEIKVVPFDAETYNYTVKYCSKIGKTLLVTKKSYAVNLESNAKYFELAKDFASKQL